MSKMDNLRAMREARYEQAVARSAKAAPSSTTLTTPSKPTAARTASPQATPETTTPVVTPESGAPEEALCGHRAISGRTCTREAGHAAKSHRYS